MKGFVPASDATVVARLRAAGALILAKSNMAEWAFSPYVTESSIAGITRNPYDLTRVPAGSSGGTAAAVAAKADTVPTPVATPPADRITDAPVPAPARALPATQVAAKPVAPASGSYMVQLAALDTEPAAHAEWSHLSRQAPSLLNERTPVIVRVPRGDKAFFRLRVGGFVSLADAHLFCGKAKASGIACTVAEF